MVSRGGQQPAMTPRFQTGGKAASSPAPGVPDGEYPPVRLPTRSGSTHIPAARTGRMGGTGDRVYDRPRRDPCGLRTELREVASGSSCLRSLEVTAQDRCARHQKARYGHSRPRHANTGPRAEVAHVTGPFGGPFGDAPSWLPPAVGSAAWAEPAGGRPGDPGKCGGDRIGHEVPAGPLVLQGSRGAVAFRTIRITVNAME